MRGIFVKNELQEQDFIWFMVVRLEMNMSRIDGRPLWVKRRKYRPRRIDLGTRSASWLSRADWDRLDIKVKKLKVKAE